MNENSMLNIRVKIDLDLKCKHCGCTKGSHSASSYHSSYYNMNVPFNYCPGHEGRMDWDEGPGTTFEVIK